MATTLKLPRKQTENAEKRREFVAAAHAARAEFVRTGMGYTMEDVHAYIRAKAKGKKARRPKAMQRRA